LIKSDSKTFIKDYKRVLFHAVLKFMFIKEFFFFKIDKKNVMFSEGSCDTEDRSNDAENSAFPSQE